MRQYHTKAQRETMQPGEPADLREYTLKWKGRNVYVSIYEHEMVQYLIEKATRPRRLKTSGWSGSVATMQGTVFVTVEDADGQVKVPTVRKRFRNTVGARKA